MDKRRLGVGAEASEAHALSRDTARLKGHLVGKKRAREQAEADNSRSQVDFEDDEESRAGAIKKKSAPKHGKEKRVSRTQKFLKRQGWYSRI